MDIPKSPPTNSDSFAFLIAKTSPKKAREQGLEDVEDASGMPEWMDAQQQALPTNEKFKFETHGGDASLLNLAS